MRLRSLRQFGRGGGPVPCYDLHGFCIRKFSPMLFASLCRFNYTVPCSVCEVARRRRMLLPKQYVGSASFWTHVSWHGAVRVFVSISASGAKLRERERERVPPCPQERKKERESEERERERERGSPRALKPSRRRRRRERVSECAQCAGSPRARE